MDVLVAGDLSNAVLDQLTGFSSEYLLVGAGAIAIGLVPFGLKRVWGLAKSLAK